MEEELFNTYLHANMWKEKNMMWSVSIRKPFQMALNTSVGNDSIDWKVRSERKIDLTARRRGINGMPNRFFTLSHSLNNDVRLNAVLCRYSKYHKNIHSSIKCNELSHSCSFTPHSRRDFTFFFALSGCCENLLICQHFSSTTCWLMILWRWWTWACVWETWGRKVKRIFYHNKGRNWYPYDNRNGTNSIFWWWMVSHFSSSSSYFYDFNLNFW